MATKKAAETDVTAVTSAETVTEENKTLTYTRNQLRNSRKFSKYKDIVSVVIGGNESCTVEECEKRIKEFLDKKCERSVK